MAFGIPHIPQSKVAFLSVIDLDYTGRNRRKFIRVRKVLRFDYVFFLKK